MPRKVDHDERRRDIIEAVWHITATQGLESVTMRAVAATAGISVGRIQHYFATKEEMVRHGCQALIDAAQESFAKRIDTVDPRAALRELVMHSIPQTQAHRIGITVWYAYLAQSVGDPGIATIMREAKRAEHKEGVHLFLKAQAGGQLRRHLDADVTTRQLLATADGLVLRVLIDELSTQQALAILDGELEGLSSG